MSGAKLGAVLALASGLLAGYVHVAGVVVPWVGRVEAVPVSGAERFAAALGLRDVAVAVTGQAVFSRYVRELAETGEL